MSASGSRKVFLLFFPCFPSFFFFPFFFVPSLTYFESLFSFLATLVDRSLSFYPSLLTSPIPINTLPNHLAGPKKNFFFTERTCTSSLCDSTPFKRSLPATSFQRSTDRRAGSADLWRHKKQQCDNNVADLTVPTTTLPPLHLRTNPSENRQGPPPGLVGGPVQMPQASRHHRTIRSAQQLSRPSHPLARKLSDSLPTEGAQSLQSDSTEIPTTV